MTTKIQSIVNFDLNQFLTFAVLMLYVSTYKYSQLFTRTSYKIQSATYQSLFHLFIGKLAK